MKLFSSFKMASVGNKVIGGHRVTFAEPSVNLDSEWEEAFSLADQYMANAMKLPVQNGPVQNQKVQYYDDEEALSKALEESLRLQKREEAAATALREEEDAAFAASFLDEHYAAKKQLFEENELYSALQQKQKQKRDQEEAAAEEYAYAEFKKREIERSTPPRLMSDDEFKAALEAKALREAGSRASASYSDLHQKIPGYNPADFGDDVIPNVSFEDNQDIGNSYFGFGAPLDDDEHSSIEASGRYHFAHPARGQPQLAHVQMSASEINAIVDQEYEEALRTDIANAAEKAKKAALVQNAVVSVQAPEAEDEAETVVLTPEKLRDARLKRLTKKN